MSGGDCFAQTWSHLSLAHRPRRHSSNQHLRDERLAHDVQDEASPSLARVSQTSSAGGFALEEPRLVPVKVGDEQLLRDGSHH